MTLTIACLTGLAMESRGFDQRLNHDSCRDHGGVVYQLPDRGFGTVTVTPCDCECHAMQDRSWMPPVPNSRYWWRNAVKGPVRAAS